MSFPVICDLARIYCLFLHLLVTLKYHRNNNVGFVAKKLELKINLARGISSLQVSIILTRILLDMTVFLLDSTCS